MTAVTAGVLDSVAGIAPASRVEGLPNNPSLLIHSGMRVYLGLGLHETKIGFLQSFVVNVPSIILQRSCHFPHNRKCPSGEKQEDFPIRPASPCAFCAFCGHVSFQTPRLRLVQPSSFPLLPLAFDGTCLPALGGPSGLVQPSPFRFQVSSFRL